ncbi:MAG TPA: hypothetical protein DEB39_00430 [Planctomycetaceae bacterium]|nr:hypothetical protein [Planctomycetaceae bacterium]
MRTLHLLAILSLLVFTGCHDPHVSGHVKFSDGTPLTGGVVILQNETSQGIGEIYPDGSFTMYQYKPGDGLKRGQYKGYISGAVIADDAGNTTSLIPAKYADMSASGITYDSDKDKGKLDIVIDAKPPN